MLFLLPYFWTPVASPATELRYFCSKFSGGLRPPRPPPELGPWTPLGAAPPNPCRTSLSGASATSVGPLHLTGTTRFARLKTGEAQPPLAKNPGYVAALATVKPFMGKIK